MEAQTRINVRAWKKCNRLSEPSIIVWYRQMEYIKLQKCGGWRSALRKAAGDQSNELSHPRSLIY